MDEAMKEAMAILDAAYEAIWADKNEQNGAIARCIVLKAERYVLNQFSEQIRSDYGCRMA
jgi:hypothetical protein